MHDVLDEERIRALCAGAGEGGRLGDVAAEVIRALTPHVSRYLSGLLREEDDAKDALSMWAEHLWRGLPGFRWESSLRVWSFKLAQNAAWKLRDEAWRKRGRRLRTTEASAIADEARRSSMMLREARAEKLARLRDMLEPEDQGLLTLRLDQELSFQEISEVLSRPGEPPVSDEALRKRFERVKKRMGELARKEGLLE